MHILIKCNKLLIISVKKKELVDSLAINIKMYYLTTIFKRVNCCKIKKNQDIRFMAQKKSKKNLESD